MSAIFTKRILSASLCTLLLGACNAQLSMPPDGADCLDKQKLKLNFPSRYCGILPLTESEGLCCYIDMDESITYFKHTSDGFRSIQDWSTLNGELRFLKRFGNGIYAVIGKPFGRSKVTVYHSDDSGRNWMAISSIRKSNLNNFWITDKGVLYMQGDWPYSVGKSRTVIASYDGGHSWKSTKVKADECAMLSNGLIFCESWGEDLFYYDFSSGNISDVPKVRWGKFLRASEDVVVMSNGVRFYKFRNGRLKKISRLAYNTPFVGYYNPKDIYKCGEVIYANINNFSGRPQAKYTMMSFFSLDEGRHWRRLGDECNDLESGTFMPWAGFGEKLYYIARDTLYIATPKHQNSR